MSGLSFFDDIGGNGAGGADFLPIVKYDARSGRMARLDRDGGDNVSHDVTRTFKAVFDLENLDVINVLLKCLSVTIRIDLRGLDVRGVCLS